MKYNLATLALLSSLVTANDPAICPVGNSPADSSVFIEHNDQKIFFCCADCIAVFQADPESYQKTATADLNLEPAVDYPVEVTFQIFGMDCPGCHGGVEKLLRKVTGIESARANYQKQEVHLVLEPGVELDENAVRKAIEAANFTMGKRVN